MELNWSEVIRGKDGYSSTLKSLPAERANLIYFHMEKIVLKEARKFSQRNLRRRPTGSFLESRSAASFAKKLGVCLAISEKYPTYRDSDFERRMTNFVFSGVLHA